MCREGAGAELAARVTSVSGIRSKTYGLKIFAKAMSSAEGSKNQMCSACTYAGGFLMDFIGRTSASEMEGKARNRAALRSYN